MVGDGLTPGLAFIQFFPFVISERGIRRDCVRVYICFYADIMMQNWGRALVIFIDAGIWYMCVCVCAFFCSRIVHIFVFYDILMAGTCGFIGPMGDLFDACVCVFRGKCAAIRSLITLVSRWAEQTSVYMFAFVFCLLPIYVLYIYIYDRLNII